VAVERWYVKENRERLTRQDVNTSFVLSQNKLAVGAEAQIGDVGTQWAS